MDLGLLQENENLRNKIREFEMNEPKRQIDLEHLSKIPVIETHISYIRQTLDNIQASIIEVPTIKNDVSWLKSWHNKIVLGIILAGTVGICSMIFTIIKRG